MSGVFGRTRSICSDSNVASIKNDLIRFGHINNGCQVVHFELPNLELFVVHNGVEYWTRQSANGTIIVFGAIDAGSLTDAEWDQLIRSPGSELPKLDGSFLAAIFGAHRGLEIWTDAHGSIPLYWTRNGDNVSFGTESAFLLGMDDPASRLNPVAFTSRVILRVASFEHTTWRGIDLLPCCTGLIATGVDPPRVESWVPKTWPISWRTCDDYAKAFLDAFQRSITRELNRSLGNSTCMSLSGGMDSRFIASNLVKLKVKFPAITYETGYGEIPRAKKVAAKLGLRHELIDLDVPFLADGGKEYLRSSSSELNLSYAHTISIYKCISARYKYVWDGVLGDQIFPKDQIQWFSSMPSLLNNETAVDYFLSHCQDLNSNELIELMRDKNFSKSYEQFRDELVIYFSNNHDSNWLVSYIQFQRKHGSIRRRSLFGMHNLRNFISPCCPFVSTELFQLSLSYIREHDDILEMYAKILGQVNLEMLKITLNTRGLPGESSGLRYHITRLSNLCFYKFFSPARSNGFARRYLREIRTTLRSSVEASIKTSQLSDAGILSGDLVRYHLQRLLQGNESASYYTSLQIFTLEHAIRMHRQTSTLLPIKQNT